MRRLIFSAGVLALALLGVNLLGNEKELDDTWIGQKVESKDSGKDQSAKFEVNIDNFSFGPADLKVPVGAKVTWTNHDDVPHTVVSTDKLFASPVLDTDQQFSYTFAKPGEYGYYCSIHPKMTAKVLVR